MASRMYEDSGLIHLDELLYRMATEVAREQTAKLIERERAHLKTFALHERGNSLILSPKGVVLPDEAALERTRGEADNDVESPASSRASRGR